MKESIVAAAILTKNKKGICIIPKPGRHHDILKEFFPVVSQDLSDQGFLTNTGRFVDRREGMIVAIEAKQLTISDSYSFLDSKNLW